MDFALLPPEINSTRMYAGPGSGSMLAAAAAWDELASELYSTAGMYQSVIDGLTVGPWVGPSASLMAAAAAPYVEWMNTAAAQAEEAASQAKAAAIAYEAAFAETVPPPVVAANRSLFLALVATNFFGQNTPAIAAAETQYSDMWAQDTAAMLGYAGASASATTLTPFAEPTSTTDPAGLSSQTAAVTQATGTAAGEVQNAVTSVQQLFSAIPGTLSGLANPAAVGDAFGPLDLIDLISDLSGLFVDPEIGTAGLIVDGILSGTALPYDINGYWVGVHTDDLVSAFAGVPSWPAQGSPPPSFPAMGGAPVAAGLGEAARVGSMSVPTGWTTAAPATRMAAALPATSVGAAAEASASGAGALFSQMALAAMAGRALAGTSGTGGSGGTGNRERIGAATRAAQPTAETDAKPEISEEGAGNPEKPRTQLPLGGPITSIAAELRELASLRDAGILTQEEFTEQKRRLLPQ